MSKKNKKAVSAEPVPASDVFIRKSQLSEFIRYLIVGFSATITTLILIGVLNGVVGIEYGVANAIASFVMIFGSFPPYKIFVFKSKSWKLKTTGFEFWTFFSARVFSFLFDAAFIFLMVSVLEFDKLYPVTILRQSPEGTEFWRIAFTIPEEWVFKFISMVVTTVANYIFSKFVSFKKR